MSMFKVVRWGTLPLCALLVASFCCTSCSKKTEALSSEDNKKVLETLAKPNQEAIVMLSHRYELKPHQIETFLDQYLSETDEGYSAFKTVIKNGKIKTGEKGAEAFVLNQDQYAKALVNASQSINIPVKIAANIVCDYKAFTQKDGSN